LRVDVVDHVLCKMCRSLRGKSGLKREPVLMVQIRDDRKGQLPVLICRQCLTRLLSLLKRGKRKASRSVHKSVSGLGLLPLDSEEP